MADLRTVDRVFLTEFIQIYRANPCLWKVRSREYFNKRAKSEAYGKLLEKMLEIDNDATRETVVKKINSIRTTFRKECKKVKERSDGIDGQYVPNLWYYDLLLFLLDQDGGNQEEVASWPLENHDQDVVEIHEVDEEFVPQPPMEESYSPAKKKFKKSKNIDKTDEVLDLVAQSLQLSQDGPLDVFGKYIASQLKDLPENMIILAQKLINSLLFEAKMGNLNNTSRILISDVNFSSKWSAPNSAITTGLSSQSSSSNFENIATEMDNSRDSNNYGFDTTVDAEINIDEESLISHVQKYPAIYDTRYRSYNDKEAKKLWEEIGLQLNYSASSCRSTWETLVESFWRTNKRVRTAQKNRTKIKLWKWYNKMSFLLSSIEETHKVNTEMQLTNDHHTATEFTSSKNRFHRQKTAKYNCDSSLSLANEDEAFFISLLPTVIKFDNDDKLDFRGDVLDTVKKIKRSRNIFYSSQSKNAFSGTNIEQRAFARARSPIQNDSQIEKILQDENFVSVKEESDPLVGNR